MYALERSFHLTDGRTARVRFSTAADGDLAVASGGSRLDERRARLVPLPWTWLTQVHGATVVDIDAPGAAAGVEADGAVTTASGTPLAVHTADCAPVALVAAEGAVGAVHVGWRGLVAGVIPRAVERLREVGARRLTAVLGPCIHAACYEFGERELDVVARAVGDVVRATTRDGRPALDLPAGVRAALRAQGASVEAGEPPCTACSGGFFSHRARRETARQAMVVWIEP